MAESATETANILAESFASAYTDETSGPLPHNCYTKCNTDDISDSLCISEVEVKEELDKLNHFKSMGPDKVHPKLLASLGEIPEFVTALTILYNKCFEEGKIPLIWKTANITPIHKKGSTTDAGNYRPISLTSVICKIYERFIRSHIYKYVSANISSKQHGFVPNKSCLSNLLETVDTINEMLAEGEGVDIFYLDFQKAFDSVPHHRLLIKLESLGITGKTLSAVSDFLSDRTFQVNVGTCTSGTHKVTSGIPQGSVLGPLLFVLYINDLCDTVKGNISLFADDVKMYCRASSYFHNQVDLIQLCEWQNQWLLNFNTKDEKCKVMHIGKENPNNKYLLNNILLPSVEQEVDLGVMFNSSWNWIDQVNNCIGKANKCIGWVTRNVICRSHDVMVNIYKSLIRPHLEYCVQLWAPAPHYGNWKLIIDIENVQRKYTRLIDGVGLKTYQERLKCLDLTTLLERRARGDLIETFKILNGLANYGDKL